jgi:hypothetical protein
VRWLGWAIAGAGILFVLVATGFIGSRDEEGETVPAGEWAQDVCGAIGVWRGEVEAITESLRVSRRTDGTEAGAPTAEGKLGAAQIALERGIQSAENLVLSIQRSGVPDTEGGEEAADQISAWANGALNDLEQAEDALDEEGDSLEDDIQNVVQAASTIAGVLESGRQVVATVATSDPALRAAISNASTCRVLRAESG